VGEPPEDLVLAFAIHLSGFATHALMTDLIRRHKQIGALTAEILRCRWIAPFTAQRSAPSTPEEGA